MYSRITKKVNDSLKLKRFDFMAPKRHIDKTGKGKTAIRHIFPLPPPNGGLPEFYALSI